MKKHYQRPMLMVEFFAVAQRLSNCSLSIGYNDAGCVLNDDDSTLMMKDLAMQGFFSGENCMMHPIGTETEDGICYHVSVNLAFSS